MGGKGSGRLSKTDSLLKQTIQKFNPVATGEMFLPNNSGDHSAGTTGTPSSDQHIVNKKYADDTFQNSLSVAAPIQLIADTLSFSFSGDNTWTGDNTFNDEVGGTKQSSLMGHNRNLSVAAGAESFIQIADLVKMTDTKGLTAIHDGSIVGISINYNCGLPSGKFSGMNLKVKVNGSSVWENEIDAANASDKEDGFTQARDVDSFSAGDTISVCLAGLGAGSISVSKIIVQLEYYYDD